MSPSEFPKVTLHQKEGRNGGSAKEASENKNKVTALSSTSALILSACGSSDDSGSSSTLLSNAI